MRADLDQVEGLSGEREALWARLDKAAFLTADEKRAAVGYGPLPRAASDRPASFADSGPGAKLLKFSPDQPRVPAGSSGGGQWTSGGGGVSSGRVRLAQAEELASYRIDVREHEGRNGGHTIAEHVGRSDEYLLARVRGERGPDLIRRRDGSFPSIEAANKLVSATLSSSKVQPGEILSNRELVGRVARGEDNGAFVTLEFDSKTGREAYAASKTSQPFLRDTYGVGVVIVRDKKDLNGFSVFDAYPRNP